ncbi:MAG: biotin transporter BioY [Clostridiales bacterium]|nr:biotin transporter BioY [Clostridiales bacterium]
MEKKKFIDVRGMVFCALFTALIAAGAFMKIQIPYVPITLQFMFTNLAGLMLGKRKGLISVCLYIFIGLAGIPIFASGGGPGYIFKPTFGYIIGFAGGTWLAGLIAERGKKDIKSFILAGLANMAVVYLMGLVYFYFMSNYYLAKPVSVKALLISGVLLCAPGDIVSCLISAVLAKRLLPLTRKIFVSA